MLDDSDLQLHALPTLSAICLVWLLYRYLVYPIYFSPLSVVPAANGWASITPLWILWIRYSQRENKIIHAAHVAHGPVVRLSPSELSVNMVDGGIRTIYGIGFDKTSWYSVFEVSGTKNTFSTLESKPHSILRRRISHVYAKSHLLSTDSGFSHVAGVILQERFLPRLQAAARADQPFDILELFITVGMDIITAYEFGLSCSSNVLSDPKEGKKWSSLYAERRRYSFWEHQLPRMKSLLDTFGIHVVPPHVAEGDAAIENRILTMLTKAEARFTDDFVGDYEGEATVYRHLRREADRQTEKLGTTSPDMGARRAEIASELFDDTFAGHENPPVTLTYLAYHLSLNPALQTRLRNELSALSADTTSKELPATMDIKAIDSIDFLNACLLETLRCYPPAAASQPRTPVAGTKAYIDLGVDGRTLLIPPGVTVSAQAYSLHRNPDVFSDPEKWEPERWLFDAQKNEKDEEERLKEMYRWFWAFGSGGRMCFGNHFSMLEMKVIAATIWGRFETVLFGPTEEVAAGMEPVSGGDLAGPVAGRLNVRLKEIC